MKLAMVFSVVFLAATSSGTVAHAATALDACGKDDVHFKVNTEKKQPGTITPEAGKAQIVFIESLDGAFMKSPTARFAVDGAWVGASRGASYFSVAVDPGDHHLCAKRQSTVKLENDNAGALTLHLEPGSTYYVEFRIQRIEVGDASMQGGAALPGQYPGSMTAKEHPTVDTASFKQLSADEGHARLTKLPLSISNTK